MDRRNRPPQRQKRTPSQGGPIRRRGSGLGMSGPLGRRRPQDMPGQEGNEFEDSYYLGEQYTVNGEPEIGSVTVNGDCKAPSDRHI